MAEEEAKEFGRRWKLEEELVQLGMLNATINRKRSEHSRAE